jgi:uncharacterized protein (DUF736 family)|tara:strand:- start:4833 stop:5111 length:279 start_codon:yes stop_codon:yes gene_type:complete
MSKYKANTGLLGINDRKEKETHPDYNGKVYVDKPGLYYLKGWKKTTRDGNPLLSLALDYADESKQVEARSQYESESFAPNEASAPTIDSTPF